MATPCRHDLVRKLSASDARSARLTFPHRQTGRPAALPRADRLLRLREDVVDHRPQPMIWLIGSPGPVAHRHELRGRRAEEDRRPRPPGVIAGEVETYSRRHACQDEGAAMPPSRGES